MPFTPTDPLFSEIDSTNLESVRKSVVFNNFFVGTPFLEKLREAGVADPYLGGAGMTEGILYGRPQGAAVNPGQEITVTRQQIDTKIKFYAKGYASWFPMDDFEMDDGSGNGGVINSGPAKIADIYQLYMEGLVQQMRKIVNRNQQISPVEQRQVVLRRPKQIKIAVLATGRGPLFCWAEDARAELTKFDACIT